MSRTVPELLSGSGTATDRIPRDRSEYTRVDNRIDSVIRRGEIESLLDFAETYPHRVGDMLGNYRLVLAQWEESNPELLRKLLTLTWNRLDISTRKQFIHLMIRMIYRTSKSESVSKGVETGEIKVSPFNFKGDEIVLDKTIEQMIEGQPLSYEQIFVLDRKKRKKAVVLMMDASGSMQGVNLSMAAVAVAALAMNLDLRDEYGVILFSEKVSVFKSIDQPKYLDQVIVGILDILPEGRTNISLGLSAGFQQIQKSGVDERFGILLTDGWQNVGHDPTETAARFPKLHVISLPGGNPEISKRIARAGKGLFVPLREMLDVPKAILKCLN
ncbi:MAG: vWA domain-containing protein [Syntrophobacteraceae bacterium]|jgi:uncharacterized protein with von Willebrand factor type A (vWA) domain